MWSVCLILVNLNHLAPVPPYSVTIEDLRQILFNCWDMYEEFEEEALTQLLSDWETALSYVTIQSVTDEWYIRAVICVCLRGLRGEECPNIINFTIQ